MDSIIQTNTSVLKVNCCQNPKCIDYGKRDHGNLTVCGRSGRNGIRLLRCKTCKSRFSERKGSVLFNIKIDPEKAVSVLKHLSEGCGIRKTSRLVGVSIGTVARLVTLSGKHAELLHEELVAFSPSY